MGGDPLDRGSSPAPGGGATPLGPPPAKGVRNGRVKAVAVKNANKATLQGLVNENVAKGTTVYTDEHRGYTGLHKQGYNHGTVAHSVKEYVHGKAHTNGVESVWGVMKRGYQGVYHHFSEKHLQLYVNEFTFRLNEGNCAVDTMDRLAALCGAMEGKRLTYADLKA